MKSVDGNQELADKIISKAYNTYASTNKTTKRNKNLPKISEAEENAKLIERARENHVLKASINKYGNYEDENHFLYLKETQIVIGKQVGDVVMKLNEQDIETCKLMFLDYDQLCIE